MSLKPYYDEGGQTIYCGDCREILPQLGKFSLILTDPPYDEKTHSGARYGFRETSSAIPFAPLGDVAATATMLLDASRGWVIAFCALEMFGAYRDGAGERWVRAGFWRRPDGVPQFTGDRPGQPGEGIAIMHAGGKKTWNGRGRHGYWECPVERDNRAHPTQKPLRLMVALVRDFAQPSDSIVDPFMGSGSTLVACKLEGQRGVGIEIEERYCEIAANRLRQKVLAF